MATDATIPKHPRTGKPLTGAARIAHERGLHTSESQARRQQMLDFRRQVIDAATRAATREKGGT